jgi:hypothetical protein
MGRKQHERVTVIGSYPSRDVALAEFISSAQQNIGVKVEYEVYAPAGTVAQTELVRLKWGAYATAAYGNKTMALISNNRKIGVLYGVAVVDQNMEYTYGEWLATSSRKPADLTAQYHAQKGVSFSDTDPLVVQFDNTSTANSVSSREYFVRYSYEKVI